MTAKKYIKSFSGATRLDLWKYNRMSEDNIENITKFGTNFAPTFVDHHVLSDMNFNGHCLVKFNDRFYIKELLVWISKAN